MRSATLTLASAIAVLVMAVGAQLFPSGVDQGLAQASSGSPIRPIGQVQGPPIPTCGVPGNSGQLPERAAEMRLVRDGYGTYWQIQSGCRHQVLPFAMNAAVLRAIPSGEDVSFISYSFPSPVPTPGPLGIPSYARLPAALLPAPTPVATPVPSDQPGYLAGYADRVLVVEDGDPNVVYLLQGGLRHRVLVFYPLCVLDRSALPAPLCDQEGPDNVLDISRSGDPQSYLLPRRAQLVDCSRIFPDVTVPTGTSCTQVYQALGLGDRASSLAAYVATVAEIPLGEPAPNRNWSPGYYTWAQGESVVISDAIAPGASKCTALPCSNRYQNAQGVTLPTYDKDPGAFEGIDVRMEGIACNVSYNRDTNATYFSLRLGDISVPAVARGRTAQRDPEFGSNVRVEVGASTSTRGGGTGFASGQLVVFEYRVLGASACPQR